MQSLDESLVASYRVAHPDSVDAPSKPALETASRRLQAAGYNVLQVGHYTVLVKAPRSVFFKHLGFVPVPNPSLRRDVVPAEPTLVGIVDRIEISAPIRYGD